MSRKNPKQLQPEPAYIGKNGKLHDDGLHEAMLNNPEADRAGRKLAFDAAIKRGVSKATAKLLYGSDLAT